jgi:hypothetical protein
MNTKPNVPEELGIGKDYWWRIVPKTGVLWMWLVFATDVPGQWLIKHHPEMSVFLRAAIAAIPPVAAAVYATTVLRWIRGMDELHRRLTIESFLFATTAYLLLGAGWSALDVAGVWKAVNAASGLHFDAVPWTNCSFIICMTYVLFGAGYSMAKRRFE